MESPAGKTILVVENDEITRAGLTAVLQSEGYSVATAASGQEALDCLRSTPASLILLAMLLPRMDGWQLMNARKGDATLAGIPIVIMTIIGIASRESAQSLGAVGYLYKRFGVDALLQDVRRHC